MVYYKKSQGLRCRWVRCFRLTRLPLPANVIGWGNIAMSVALQMGGAAWPSEEFGNSVEALEFGLEVMLGEGNVLRSWDTILYYDDKHDLVLGDILVPYSVASTAQWCCPYIRPTYRVTCNDEVMALVDIPLVITKAIHKSADIDE